ncbi:permease, partial [Candidatus Fermentibacteria bacterium]
MSPTAIVINSLVGLALTFSLLKSRKKTLMGLKIAWKAAGKMLPAVLLVIVVIGLFLGFVSPSFISGILGSSNGLLGVAIAAVLGSVLFIPAILAFPMGASLMLS